MTDCRTIDPLATPYVDGELATAERLLVFDHLRECASCRSRMAAEQSARDALRAGKIGLQRAPDSLRARCAALVQAPPAEASSWPIGPGVDERVARPRARLWRLGVGRRPEVAGAVAQSGASDSSATDAVRHRPRWSTRLAPLALAATIVVVLAGAFAYRVTETSAEVLAAELTADHVKCFALNGLLRTRHSASVVERSMASTFGWPVHLPDTERAGLELVGSRPCLYAEGRIAHIMFSHNGRPVSLFMLPGTSRPEQLVGVLGHEAAIWCVGNRTFVLIANESRSEVERMASVVHASLR